MMRRGRHLVPKREGLAPLIVYVFSIRILASIARVFRERNAGDAGSLCAFRLLYIVSYHCRTHGGIPFNPPFQPSVTKPIGPLGPPLAGPSKNIDIPLSVIPARPQV